MEAHKGLRALMADGRLTLVEWDEFPWHEVRNPAASSGCHLAVGVSAARGAGKVGRGRCRALPGWSASGATGGCCTRSMTARAPFLLRPCRAGGILTW